MENRKELIRKKTALLKVKQDINKINSLYLIDLLEVKTDKIKKYINQIHELNSYDYPEISSKTLDEDNIMIKWIIKEISILKDSNIWVMPFDEMGIWWIKVKVLDWEKAIEQLWYRGEFCIIEESNKKCFYIQFDEDKCLIKYKQLV